MDIKKTKVLMSIHPEYILKIFSGSKKYEYRKTLYTSVFVDTIVMYSTSPVKMIVGEFKTSGIMISDPKDIWFETEEWSGLNKKAFFDYYKGYDEVGAIHIDKVIVYKEQIKGEVFRKDFRPPQSFNVMKTLDISTTR